MGVISYYFLKQSDITRPLLKLVRLAWLLLGVIAAVAMGLLGIVVRSVGFRSLSRRLLDRGISMIEGIELQIGKVEPG